MGYNKENFKRIREEYATKHLVAENEANVKRSLVHAKFPEIAQIDSELSKTWLDIMQASLSANREEEISRLKAKNIELNTRRDAILTSAGYPANYTDPQYSCSKCADSGYVGINMCDCMKKELINAGFESSGIAKLLDTQTFENFSLDYYRYNEDIFQKMQFVYNVVKKYADEFDPATSGNLALFGGTGLGKTHLSSALARRVIEKGYDVVYVTAIQLVSDFETEQFSQRTVSRGEFTDRYFDCDLLLIDDLGAENVNQFTISTIYNLINIRINRKMPTVISTNCMQNELMKKYSERITSRIYGEFRPLIFLGNDVRMLKLTK